MLFFKSIGEKFMEIDWEGMTLFGKTFGIEWVVIILLIFSIFGIIILFSRQMKSQSEASKDQADAIQRLSKSVEFLAVQISPHLDMKQSILFYRSTMQSHIIKKLRYLGDILRANSIKSRRAQITINIEREFRRITTEEASTLSEVKSVCGDMGKIVQDNLKWPEFLKAVTAIFFGDDEEHQKIKDIRLLMESEVDTIALILEDNGVRN